MKMSDMRAKARAIFGPAIAEPMPKQPNGAKALQERANARPIPTYKVGGAVKKNTPPQPTAADREADRKRREEYAKMKVTPENAAAIGRGNRSSGYKTGGKVQTSADTAKKLATEMGGMKKGGKAKKDGLAVMIAIGEPMKGMKKPVKKAVGGSARSMKAPSTKTEFTPSAHGKALREHSKSRMAETEAELARVNAGVRAKRTSFFSDRPAPVMPMTPKMLKMSETARPVMPVKKAVGGGIKATAQSRMETAKARTAKSNTLRDAALSRVKAEIQTKRPSAFAAKRTPALPVMPETVRPVMPETVRPVMPNFYYNAKGEERPYSEYLNSLSASDRNKELSFLNTPGASTKSTPQTPVTPPKPLAPNDVTPIARPPAELPYKKGGKVEKPIKRAAGGAGKTRKGMAPIKKAQGGAGKVRKGMMTPEGQITHAMNKIRGK